jgi:hypothetical protein
VIVELEISAVDDNVLAPFAAAIVVAFVAAESDAWLACSSDWGNITHSDR